MSIQSVYWLVCLLVTLVTHSHGFQFSMTRTPNNSYCGYLQCSTDISQTDTHIHTLIGLTISDIVHGNTHIRLASVSLFDSEPHVEPTRVLALTATGSVTRYHGNITIALRDETNCQFGSFLCELTYVNVSNLPDRVSQILTSERTGTCETSSDPIATMAVQIRTHSFIAERKFTDLDDKLSQLWDLNTEIDRKLTELGSSNTTTMQELAKFRDQIVAMKTHDHKSEQLSVLQGEDNTSEGTCTKGTPHTRVRELINLWGKVPALCDTRTDGKGWVIIQRRTKGDVDFNRGWDDYKKGFGTSDTDYWLGNDNIHNLTSEGYTNLRVDIAYQGVKYFADYSNFIVADEISKYKLTVGGYHGNATDQLSYNSGMFFSTIDRDNDEAGGPCVKSNSREAAWWHKFCTKTNLNGLWGAKNYAGLYWHGVVYPGSVTSSEMKVRQV